jgi:hypothetical protein
MGGVIMEWFIGWIVFSFLVGWFWQTKGLSFGVGLAWSLFLSPLVGFFIGILKEPDRKQQEAMQIAAGDARKCPFCAEMIKREATVCRFCGRDMPAAPPAPPSEPEWTYGEKKSGT